MDLCATVRAVARLPFEPDHLTQIANRMKIWTEHRPGAQARDIQSAELAAGVSPRSSAQSNGVRYQFASVGAWLSLVEHSVRERGTE